MNHTTESFYFLFLMNVMLLHSTGQESSDVFSS